MEITHSIAYVIIKIVDMHAKCLAQHLPPLANIKYSIKMNYILIVIYYLLFTNSLIINFIFIK